MLFSHRLWFSHQPSDSLFPVRPLTSPRLENWFEETGRKSPVALPFTKGPMSSVDFTFSWPVAVKSKARFSAVLYTVGLHLGIHRISCRRQQEASVLHSCPGLCLRPPFCPHLPFTSSEYIGKKKIPLILNEFIKIQRKLSRKVVCQRKGKALFAKWPSTLAFIFQENLWISVFFDWYTIPSTKGKKWNNCLSVVSSLFVSLGHTGRRVVWCHTWNTQTLTKTDEQKKGFK